jgi:hypothetical protein
MNSANTQAQAEQEEFNNTIKFTHVEDGKIEFNQGCTIFSDLLMLGAFAGTKTFKSDPNTAWREYATDAEGLEELELKSGEMVSTLADTIGSLGVLLAHVDRREVGDKHLSNYAWLIAGLGELLTQVAHENQEIASSLLKLSKQAGLEQKTPNARH